MVPNNPEIYLQWSLAFLLVHHSHESAVAKPSENIPIGLIMFYSRQNQFSKLQRIVKRVMTMSTVTRTRNDAFFIIWKTVLAPKVLLEDR